jgi:hypothetical protein
MPVDLEREAPEAPLAEDVRERLAPFAPAEELRHPSELRSRERSPPVRANSGTGGAENVREDQLGVDVGRLTAGGVEPSLELIEKSANVAL